MQGQNPIYEPQKNKENRRMNDIMYNIALIKCPFKYNCPSRLSLLFSESLFYLLLMSILDQIKNSLSHPFSS